MFSRFLSKKLPTLPVGRLRFIIIVHKWEYQIPLLFFVDFGLAGVHMLRFGDEFRSLYIGFYPNN